MYEDGKPLDQWALFIAPNVVVSFSAALAKSSFLLAITEVSVLSITQHARNCDEAPNSRGYDHPEHLQVDRVPVDLATLVDQPV